MPNNLTGSQVMRIAAALHVYGRRLSGPTWIAMQIAEPHDILGFANSDPEARALIDPNFVTAFDTFGPFDPPVYPSFENRLSIRSHDCATGGQVDAAAPGSFGVLPMISDMTSVEVTIKWGAGGTDQTAVFNIFDGTDPALPRPDTIFLSRASSEAFMYPRYEMLFGTRIVDLLRTKLGDV